MNYEEYTIEKVIEKHTSTKEEADNIKEKKNDEYVMGKAVQKRSS